MGNCTSASLNSINDIKETLATLADIGDDVMTLSHLLALVIDIQKYDRKTQQMIRDVLMKCVDKIKQDHKDLNTLSPPELAREHGYIIGVPFENSAGESKKE